jgi:competence protein ComEA
MRNANMLNGAITSVGVKKVISVLGATLFPFLAWAGPVDMNTADAATIARELNGVGQARAEAIVEYRDEFGAFQSAEDLLNVTGIGKYILEANEQNILIEPAH